MALKARAATLTTREVRGLAPSLRAAARAGEDGAVLDVEGDMDAESACAAALLAAQHVDRLVADLGLGAPSAWHLSVGGPAWYVVHNRPELLVAMGEPSKNPGSVLQKILAGCRR